MKHYLNTTLKGKVIDGVKCYPVYVSFTVQRQTYKLRSKAFKELISKANFKEIDTTEDERIIKNCTLRSYVHDKFFDKDCFFKLYYEFYLNLYDENTLADDIEKEWGSDSIQYKTYMNVVKLILD